MWTLLALIACGADKGGTSGADTAVSTDSDSGETAESAAESAVDTVIDSGDSADSGDTGASGDSGESGDTGESGGIDADGDGYPVGTDCDDADPAIHPGAEDPCDRVDQDCDGLLAAEGACSDVAPASAHLIASWRTDAGVVPYSSRFLGDLDGDGRDDLGWMVEVGTGTEAWVIPGETGLGRSAASDVLIRVYGDVTYDLPGGIIPAGDVDNDGNPDAWVISWSYGTPALLLGPPSAWSPTEHYWNVGPNLNGFPGATPGGQGADQDLSGDGIPDAAFTRQRSAETGEGGVSFVTGGAAPEPTALLDADDAEQLLLLDLEGDGLTDALVFDGSVDLGVVAVEHADLVSGGRDLRSVAAFVVADVQDRVIGAGDVDGDGLEDWLGTDGATLWWFPGGMHAGGAPIPPADLAMGSVTADTDLGFAPAGLTRLCDMDDDGLPEVGEVFLDRAGDTVGVFPSMDGAPPMASPRASVRSWVIALDTGEDLFGPDILSGGDLAGDGGCDLSVAGAGAVRVYDGTDLPWEEPSAW